MPKETSERNVKKRLAQLAAMEPAHESAEDQAAGSVAAIVAHYLDVGRLDWSPTTTHGYEVLTGKHITPDAISSMRADEVTISDVSAFYERMRRPKKDAEGNELPGCSAAIVTRVHMFLHAVFEREVKEQRLTANPTTHARRPRHQTPRIELPAAEKVLAAIHSMMDRDPWMGSAFRVLAATGMRRGELIALRADDVDLANHRITIARSVVKVGSAQKIKRTKSGRTRDVLIDAETTEVIRDQLKRVRAVAREAGVKVANPYIWPSEKELWTHATASEPMDPNLLTGTWRRHAKRAGIPSVHLHSLRHFHASYLLQHGASIAAVQHRLGHQAASTTLNLYSHALPGADAELAEAMGAALAARRPSELEAAS